jgi:hypothetical protein
VRDANGEAVLTIFVGDRLLLPRFFMAEKGIGR